MGRKIDLESNMRTFLIIVGVVLATLSLLVAERVLVFLGWYHSAPAFSADELRQTYDDTMLCYKDLRKRFVALWRQYFARPDGLAMRVQCAALQAQKHCLHWLQRHLNAWAWHDAGAKTSV